MRQRGNGEMAPTVLYDGTCRFCLRQVDRLRRITRSRVAFENAYAPGVRDRFPNLPPLGEDGKMGEMKFADAEGRVVGGAAAVAGALVAAGGPLGMLARSYAFAPVRLVADRAYRIASARRLRAAARDCGDGTCDTGTP